MRKGAVAREGYKKTELGWIPGDWEVKRLGECVRTAPSYGMNAPAVKFNEKLPVYLRITDISDDGRFIAETKVSVNHLAYKEFYLEVNDIVFARTGASTGKTYLYTPFDGLLVYAGFLIKFSINPEILNPVFLKYFTFTNSYWNWVKIMSSRSGQPGINAQEYQLIKIPLPPLPEQKKIAKILSTWDEAIEKLNSYIEAKKKLKKALMQRLLTGKQRFKEFVVKDGYKKTELGWIPEDWEVKRFDEVFSFLKVEPLSREALTDKDNDLGIYNIHYGDLHATYKSELLDFDKEERVPRVKDSVTLSHNVSFLEDGDLVIADVSEDYQGIGTCIELKNLREKKVLGGLHTFSVRDYSKKTAEGFRVYLLKSFQVLTALKRIATGVSVYGISKTNLSKIKIPLPPLPEQKKIAEILSKADEEIDLLNQELEKLKTQKKGLMQKLLTGAWRVRL